MSATKPTPKFAAANTIGKRIQNFRERLQMSPNELAKQTGLDEALIGGIERGDVYPSIGTLARIARKLGQRLGTFMDDQFHEDPLIVRASTRENGTASHKATAYASGFCYAPLSRGKSDRHIDAFHIDIAPNAEELLSSHEGEEFIVVIAGEVELTYGERKFVLSCGDSAHYNSIVHHLVKAKGAVPASIYAVIFIPF